MARISLDERLWRVRHEEGASKKPGARLILTDAKFEEGPMISTYWSRSMNGFQVLSEDVNEWDVLLKKGSRVTTLDIRTCQFCL